MTLTVKVQFCKHSGYGDAFIDLYRKLRNEFGDKVLVTCSSPVEDAEGSFEVSIGTYHGMELVHSKANGDGLADSEEELLKITAFIRNKLDNPDSIPWQPPPPPKTTLPGHTMGQRTYN